MNWEIIEEYLNKNYLENSLKDILICFGIIIFGLLLKRAISSVVSRIFFRFVKKKSAENVTITDFLRLLRKPLEFLIILIIIYIAFSRIKFPDSWHLVSEKEIGLRMVVQKVFYIFLIIAITRIILRFVDFFAIIFIHKAEETTSTSDNQLIPFVREVGKVFIVIFAFLFVLGTVFNLDIASVIAGLGIGGLAVALAAKESLENLFASFTIFLDKPFVTGDLVKVGDIQGTVERVGFRSTRMRTLDKSYLTVPNKMMIDQALDNLSQRNFRRARFVIQLQYSTSSETIKPIVEEIKTLLLGNELTNIEAPSVYFDAFGDNSINLLVLFLVATSSWDEFMKTKETINYQIMEIVSRNGAEFAYPSNKVFIQTDITPAANQVFSKSEGNKA